MSRFSLIAAFVTLIAFPALADFMPVRAEGDFRALIEGRELTRFGIRLQVLPQGRITGSGFGFAVGGMWEWQNGYFCRTLEFAGTGDPYNCQLVLRDGNMLRFIKDQGNGDFADLRLR